MKWKIAAGLVFLQNLTCFASLDFFEVAKPKFHNREPRDQYGVWNFQMNGRVVVKRDFQPNLEVKITPKENIFPSKIVAKAYFYNADNKLVSSLNAPSKSGLKNGIPNTHLPFPPLLKAKEPAPIHFGVPDTLKDKDWKAVNCGR